ncbi:hypothetical protein ABZU76_35465 [Amycolatopsis sp. NPDC005232]
MITENDVNAFLLGELSTTDRQVISVVLGTGVGGASACARVKPTW